MKYTEIDVREIHGQWLWSAGPTVMHFDIGQSANEEAAKMEAKARAIEWLEAALAELKADAP